MENKELSYIELMQLIELTKDESRRLEKKWFPSKYDVYMMRQLPELTDKLQKVYDQPRVR